MNFQLLSKIYFSLIYSLISWFLLWPGWIIFLFWESIQTKILWYCIFIFGIWVYALIWMKKKKIIWFLLILHLWIIFGLFLLFGKQEINQQDGDYVSVSLWKTYSWNLLNIFTEKELLNMGFAAAFMLQISAEQKENFQNIFYEIENSHNISLPTAIPNAIINKKEQRYILYNPETSNKENLIFILHWNAGWFLFYQKIFQSLADKHQAKIVMPQFAWGNWNETWWKELIYTAYNDVLQKNIISPNTKITVIAVSNGWVWVAEILKSDTKNIFSHVVCISCVFDKNEYKKVLSKISEKKFLILHGDRDDRTPVWNYLQIKNLLPEHNETIYKNEDHFLLLHKKDEIIWKIDSFLQ